MLTEDAILARELGRLGGVGAKLVARWLPTNVGEHELVLAVPPDHVREAILRSFEPNVEDELSDGSIRVRVGAGRLNLNPALITFRLFVAPSGTVVRLRGAAKEGLVRQRAGEEAATWALNWLRNMFETPGPPTSAP